jgi:hypothetical protein
MITGRTTTGNRAFLAKLVLAIGAMLGSNFAHALTCFSYLNYEVREETVYFHSRDETKEVRGIDVATFRVLGEIGLWSTLRCPVHRYAADRTVVLFDGQRIEDADASTFRVIEDGSVYASDRSYGYQYGKRTCIWTAEPASLLRMCDPQMFQR